MCPDRFSSVIERYRSGDPAVKNELEAYFVYMAENHHVGDPKLDDVTVEDIVQDLYIEVERTKSTSFYHFLGTADISVLYHLNRIGAKTRKELKTKFFTF